MHFDLSLSGADTVAERLAATPHVRKVPNPKLAQFLVPGFFSLDDCAALIERIDARVRPSTITDDIGDPEFRTSETGELDHGDPLIAAIDARICALVGIDAAFGEPLQGQRYDVGQQFKGHTDYFEPTGVDFHEHTHVSGQRTWTVMAYLNAVDAGGATRFLSTGKLHQPEVGKLLAWCNLTPDGQTNPHTLHQAMKVRKGRKYVITKWFREKPWPWG
ncbi:MAG: 2OG-Fe(II) oxygenase [Pseudomonadota bacterium]